MPELSHVNDRGEVSMVDVGEKDPTRREATAEAIVRMKTGTLDAILGGQLPKGDVLATARIAGILAAKQTSSLIPLTHPLPLDHVEIRFEPDRSQGTLRIEATVRCHGRTGVEIEAMTACAITALTVYDMGKSAEKGMVIESIRLLHKSGGKSGEYGQS